MPRINNFTAKHDTPDAVFFWDNADTDITVRVVKQDKKYRTIVSSENSSHQIVPLCNSRNEARKIAVTWMKNNPRPEIQ